MDRMSSADFKDMNRYLASIGEPVFVRKKERSIEELHRLYLMTLQRFEERYKVVKELMIDITNSFQPDCGYWSVYFQSDVNGVICQYNISKNYNGGFSYSIDQTDTSSRKMKAAIFIEGKEFEMGTRLRYLQHTLRTDWHNLIFGRMWKKVDDYIRKQFKLPFYYPEQVITVAIGGIDYHVRTEQKHSENYMNFVFMGVATKNHFTL